MKISIITAAYNKESCIGTAIESVLEQDYVDIEYIVVEGKSDKDNTWEVVLNYMARSGYRHGISKAVSEEDEGLYDALNKGISMATGDYIGFVHADDMLFGHDTISKIVRRIEDTNCDILYGNGVYVSANDTKCIVRDWIGGAYDRRNVKWGWLPLHPTVYIKREVYMKYGLYDKSYRIAGDTDLLVRFLRRNDLKVVWMDDYVIRMRMGGMSTSPWDSIKKWKEDMRLYSRHGYVAPFTLACKIGRKIPQYVSQSGFYSYLLNKILTKMKIKKDSEKEEPCCSACKSCTMLILAAVLTLAGCVSKEKVTYMQGIDEIYSEAKLQNTTYEIKIQPDDQLAISVSSQEKELLEPFTSKILIGSSSGNGGGSSNGKAGMYFTVDKSGVIEFPVFGLVKVEGYTRNELARMLEQRLKSGGYVSDPVVSVEIMSFKVSVLGEVGSPGLVTTTGERLSIYEAITQAGDIKPTGLRQKVLVVREQNGKLQSYRIDLSNAEKTFNSPAYYLKQNDIVYVEPNSAARVDGSPVYKYLSALGSVMGFISTITAIILLGK